MVCAPVLRHNILSMETPQPWHKKAHDTKGVSLRGSGITSLLERMPSALYPGSLQPLGRPVASNQYPRTLSCYLLCNLGSV